MAKTIITTKATRRARFGIVCMLGMLAAGLSAQSAHSETLLAHATRASISVSAEVVESCTISGSSVTIAAHANCVDGSPYSVATSTTSADVVPTSTVTEAGSRFIVVTF